MTFTVGYRRPPKSGQFTKGKSGNPRGRPKGSKNFVTLLEQELAVKVVVNDNGRKKSVTRIQAMVMRLVANGLQGDLKTLLTLFEILRKTGQLDSAPADDLLPSDFESALDSYVKQKLKKQDKQS